MAVDFLHLTGSALLELQDIAIIVIDTDRRVTHWSKGAERLLEINSDRALGQQVEKVIHFAHIKSVDVEALQAFMACMESHRAEGGDSLAFIEPVCISLKDESNSTAGFLLVVQDNTGQWLAERARAEAEEASRAKDMFMAMVAHELRTPLNSILGWVRMFDLGMISDAEIPQAFTVIERNAKSLLSLIEDIVDFSRIAAGKLRLDIQQVDLLAVIDKALYSLRPAAAAKQISMKAALDTSIGPVAGDPERLQQVVSNLLSNAIHFSPDSGGVEVKLERAGDKARMSISDTGPGISEGFLPYIFDPFSQAGVQAATRQSGLGLGLAIVRQMVEMHGGAIGVDSREGHGTTFTVELPFWKGLDAPAG